MKGNNLQPYRGEAFFDEGTFYSIFEEGGVKVIKLDAFYYLRDDGENRPGRMEEYTNMPLLRLDTPDLVYEIQDIETTCGDADLYEYSKREFRKATKVGYYDNVPEKTYILPYEQITPSTPVGFYFSPITYVGEKVYVVVKKQSGRDKIGVYDDDAQVSGIYESEAAAREDFRYNIAWARNNYSVDVLAEDDTSFVARFGYKGRHTAEDKIQSVSMFIFEVGLTHSMTTYDPNTKCSFANVAYGVSRGSIVAPEMFNSKEEAQAAVDAWKSQIADIYKAEGINDAFAEGDYYEDRDSIISYLKSSSMKIER